MRESSRTKDRSSWISAASAWLAPLLRPIYAGVGCILAFHRVTDDARRPRLGNTETETPPELLGGIIDLLQRWKYDFVTIDEAVTRLREERFARRFAVLTFDDGYVDHVRDGLAVLRRYGAPATLYVCSDFLSGRASYWWYVLEDELLVRDEVVLETEQGLRRWPAGTLDQKRAAFVELSAVLAGTFGAAQDALLRAMFGEEAVRRVSARLALGWDELLRVASCDDVSVGCHTASHPVLGAMEEAEVVRELESCKVELEARLGRPVTHLAYPYGSRAQVGVREFRLAARCRFASAVTTRIGHIFSEHRHHLHALPRLYSLEPRLEAVHAQLSGMAPCLRHRGRRVVTA